jgi:alpha-L-fucosidase
VDLQYDLPTSWGSGYDNIIAEGQVLELPNATYVHELHIVYAGDGIYTDGEYLS